MSLVVEPFVHSSSLRELDKALKMAIYMHDLAKILLKVQEETKNRKRKPIIIGLLK